MLCLGLKTSTADFSNTVLSASGMVLKRESVCFQKKTIGKSVCGACLRVGAKRVEGLKLEQKGVKLLLIVEYGKEHFCR